MLLLFLFFSRRLLVQFFFHSQSRACGEADHRAEVFSGNLRLHAPPLFLGVLILVHQCPHGSQSGHGGHQRNRSRIAAAPYHPASAAVPRISTSMIHLRATSRLKSGSQSIHLEEYLSLRFPTRSSSLFISVSDLCISVSDRRTVYGAVALLIEIGYDISIYEDNGVGYYLRSRELEQSEVLLLTDAVYSFPFIPAKQTEQLVQKLQKQLSVYQRKRYRYLTISRQDRKTDNRQVFWNIEQLDEAIAQKKKVRLGYLHYGLDKKQHETKTYTLSPYEMVYMNERYYLICVPDHAPNTRLYRIDRMKDIQILDDPRSKAVARQEAQNAVYAYVGAPERIIMYCDRAILDDVIDRFGTEVQIRERDENTFTAGFTAPPRGVKFWALQYLPYVEVVEPKWLRGEIIESLGKNKYLALIKVV